MVVSATMVMVMTWISDDGDVEDAADNDTDEIVAVGVPVDSDIISNPARRSFEKLETSISLESQET